MTEEKKPRIFFVDDQPKVRAVARTALEKAGYEVLCFDGAEACLQTVQTDSFDMVITDIKMPGMDGLTLLSKVKKAAPSAPVLVITAYGDIPMAIRAMKLGAADFIEKPLERGPFLQKVEDVLASAAVHTNDASTALTKVEQNVLKLMLDGKSNKEMAYAMKRSIRTVEMHRSSIMHKFDVDNLVDLVKRVSAYLA